MTAYEYSTVEQKGGQKREEILNSMGEKGWRLVCIEDMKPTFSVMGRVSYPPLEEATFYRLTFMREKHGYTKYSEEE